MLTFLQGASGSGKTTYILNKIREDVSLDKKIYFLVPEQLSYTSEAMLADLPASASLCLEVVSFSRLASIVFSALGGLHNSHISSGERNLVMWMSLRQVSGFLKEYRNVKKDAAFTSMVLSAVNELRVSSISPEKCESLAEKCSSPSLSSKLSDISMLYANYNANLSALLGESALDNENKLSALAQILSENNFFKGSNFYVDSFTSFTAEEIKILKEIILQADNTCLSLPYTRGQNLPHCKSISETLRKFTAFAKDKNIEFADVILDKNLRTDKKELLLIDKYLWDFSIKPDKIDNLEENERGALELFVAKNEFDEIRLSALKVLEARKNGAKFSEIAVIMRDCESRQGIIDAVYSDLGIPYFYSHKTDLSSTAAARLIISALKCISYNFRREDVINLIKTGLCPVSARECGMFDDYCNTWQINGNDFLKDVWSMNPDGYQIDVSDRGREILAVANSVRRTIITPLITLKNAFSAANNNTAEQCRAIYAYLEEMHLRESLSNLAELSLSIGDIREAGEILRLYEFIISVLTEISLVMKNESTTAEELSSAIEIILKNTDIGSVPSSSDYVTLGSADTLRVEGIKVAILLGLNEGEFPASFSERGLFSEDDKRILEDELETELFSREEKTVSDELFYAYRAMSKPSDKLILIRSTAKLDGKALTTSSAWNRVKYLLKDRKNDKEIPEIEFDFENVKLLATFADKNGNINSKNLPSYKNGEDAQDSGLDSDKNCVQIDPLYVRMLFGDKLHLSKSRISTFAECPYKYWCNYVLNLREQKQSLVTYNNSGTIIHYVLEKFVTRNKQNDGSLKPLSKEEVVNCVNGIVEEYVIETNCPITPSTKFSFSRLRDLSLIMVKSVIEEFSASSFRIFSVEQPIRDNREGALKPIEIKISNENGSPIVSLGGVIDRIDIFDNGNQKFLRVVDYKTGKHNFDVSKIENGQDLQLPAYLFTATLNENKDKFNSDKEIIPVSALFLSADEKSGKIKPLRSGFILNDKDILKAANKNLSSEILLGVKKNKTGQFYGKAAVDKDKIKDINSVMQQTIADTARNMYSGRVPRTPSNEACKFCPLKNNCPQAIQ